MDVCLRRNFPGGDLSLLCALLVAGIVLFRAGLDAIHLQAGFSDGLDALCDALAVVLVAVFDALGRTIVLARRYPGQVVVLAGLVVPALWLEGIELRDTAMETGIGEAVLVGLDTVLVVHLEGCPVAVGLQKIRSLVVPAVCDANVDDLREALGV